MWRAPGEKGVKVTTVLSKHAALFNHPPSTTFGYISTDDRKHGEPSAPQATTKRDPVSNISELPRDEGSERTNEKIVIEPSQDDLWDVSKGVTTVAHSPVWAGSDIRNMFGQKTPASSLHVYEHDKTLFPPVSGGTVHFVEWETVRPVTIRRVSLTMTNAKERIASRVRVLAFDESKKEYRVLFDLPPARLSSAVSVDEVTAQRFRAEFTQAGEPSKKYYGPRVFELDGFAN